MRRRRYVQLEYPPELASGARLGGKFVGPYAGKMAIWKGRPPTLSAGDDLEPSALVIQMDGGPVGSTVTIEFEGGNAWGGITTRQFQIGQGLSAELQAGAFAHIVCRAVTPLVEGQELTFSWTNDIIGRSDLYKYQAVTTGTNYNLPEGCSHIIPEQACNIVFQIPQFGTTFTKSAIAGEEIPALWGAFQTNQTQNIIYRLRGV